MKDLLDIREDVRRALEEGRPVLALESTIISHGMPYPRNLETAFRAEELARERGVTPATVGIADGRIRIGLTEELIQRYRAGERDFILLSLRKSDLRGADLYHANLSGSDLSEADLGGANLTGARLRRADLNWASLTGANLGGADLGSADLRNADLTEADLSYANLRKAKVGPEQLSRAASALPLCPANS